IPAAATDRNACSWSLGTELNPGDQFAVTRSVSKPAAFASPSFDIATCGSAFRPSSSAAPMYIWALACAATGTASAARAQRSAMRDRSRSKRWSPAVLRGQASVGTWPESVNLQPPRKIPPKGESDLGQAPIIDRSQDLVAKLSPQGAPGSSPQPPQNLTFKAARSLHPGRLFSVRKLALSHGGGYGASRETHAGRARALHGAGRWSLPCGAARLRVAASHQ